MPEQFEHLIEDNDDVALTCPDVIISITSLDYVRYTDTLSFWDAYK